jgi:hypothetical protein
MMRTQIDLRRGAAASAFHTPPEITERASISSSARITSSSCQQTIAANDHDRFWRKRKFSEEDEDAHAVWKVTILF